MSKAKVKREAIDWLVKIKTAESLDEIWPEFEKWLEVPEHRAMYRDMERIWKQIGRVLRSSPKARGTSRQKRKKRRP